MALQQAMDTEPTATKRPEKPQRIFEKLSPDKKAARTALQDIYGKVAIQQPLQPQDEDTKTRGELIQILSQDLLRKNPSASPADIIRIQAMTLTELKKEHNKMLEGLPRVPSNGEGDDEDKAKPKPKTDTKERVVKKTKQQEKKGKQKQQEQQQQAEQQIEEVRSTAQMPPMTEAAWMKTKKALVQEQAEIAGVQWTQGEMNKIRRGRLTRQMMINRIKQIKPNLVL